MHTDHKYRINSCTVSDCAPTWSWKTDKAGFDDYDLWAVFRGSGRLFVGEDEFAVKPGVCMLLPPHRAIVGEHDASDPLLVMNVHFSVIDKEAFLEPYDVQQRFIEDTGLFEKLLDRVISFRYAQNDRDAEIWFGAVLSEFFSSRQLKSDEIYTDTHIACIKEVCAKVNSASANVPKLGELAEEYGYSSAYLGKLFHKLMGISFSGYLLNSRIDKAKRLLRSTEAPISAIAEQLGYCDVCFFIKQFKGIVGLTPGKYRRQNSGSQM
ncbi:MAG: helix-turn-helix transcriptional regulator [Clostridia bacterium]|nr:helix-turn-helix transcriptional regulator [Clostridia bacterium]